MKDGFLAILIACFMSSCSSGIDSFSPFGVWGGYIDDAQKDDVYLAVFDANQVYVQGSRPYRCEYGISNNIIYFNFMNGLTCTGTIINLNEIELVSDQGNRFSIYRLTPMIGMLDAQYASYIKRHPQVTILSEQSRPLDIMKNMTSLDIELSSIDHALVQDCYMINSVGTRKYNLYNVILRDQHMYFISSLKKKESDQNIDDINITNQITAIVSGEQRKFYLQPDMVCQMNDEESLCFFLDQVYSSLEPSDRILYHVYDDSFDLLGRALLRDRQKRNHVLALYQNKDDPIVWNTAYNYKCYNSSNGEIKNSVSDTKSEFIIARTSIYYSDQKMDDTWAGISRKIAIKIYCKNDRIYVSRNSLKNKYIQEKGYISDKYIGMEYHEISSLINNLSKSEYVHLIVYPYSMNNAWRIMEDIINREREATIVVDLICK